MTKKNISSILAKATPKQRALIFAENRARESYGQGELLTDQEMSNLRASFKTPAECKLFNKFLRLGDILVLCTKDLQGTMFEAKMKLVDLRGLVYAWMNIDQAEQMVNTALHEIKDVEERKRIATKAGRDVYFLWANPQIDTEGYIELPLDPFDGLTERIEQAKEKAVGSVVTFLSWKKAVTDCMDEHGFDVKVFREYMELFTKELEAPLLGLPKYEEGGAHYIGRLGGKYSVFPNVQALQADEQIAQDYKQRMLHE